MTFLALHHVSIIISDLQKSLPFYCDVIGLKELSRPDFPVKGAWLACGDQQVHLVVHPDGTFRQNPVVDRNDTHFAFRTDNFESVADHLAALGFSEDLPDTDPRRIMMFRNGIAGFPQIYLRDPDANIIEINGAP